MHRSSNDARPGSERQLARHTHAIFRHSAAAGEFAYAWHAKESVRFLYDISNPDVADRYLAELAADLQEHDFPIP